MSAPLEQLVDGRSCSESWPQDRALQYGDGLFETMQVRSGRIRFQSLHAARLALGCNRLQIPADHALIWQQASSLAQRHGEALLKLLLSRGVATARGYAPSGAESPRLMFSVFAAPLDAGQPAEIRVVTSGSLLGENPQLAGIKHCSRLEQVLARAGLAGTGAFEGLMGSSSGQLISGTMSNVFLELDGELVTPELDRCGIAGVMRAVVLREAQRAGSPVRIAQLPMSALARCTGLALSNARLGLLPVHRVDGRGLQTEGRLRNLAQMVEQLDD